MNREIDEQLAALCHVEIAGGEESLAEAVAGLQRPELERLLRLAVIEILESHGEAERYVGRTLRRLEQ